MSFQPNSKTLLPITERRLCGVTPSKCVQVAAIPGLGLVNDPLARVMKDVKAAQVLLLRGASLNDVNFGQLIEGRELTELQQIVCELLKLRGETLGGEHFAEVDTSQKKATLAPNKAVVERKRSASSAQSLSTTSKSSKSTTTKTSKLTVACVQGLECKRLLDFQENVDAAFGVFNVGITRVIKTPQNENGGLQVHEEKGYEITFDIPPDFTEQRVRTALKVRQEMKEGRNQIRVWFSNGSSNQDSGAALEGQQQAKSSKIEMRQVCTAVNTIAMRQVCTALNTVFLKLVAVTGLERTGVRSSSGNDGWTG